jgi:cholesterol transport system auxiliary component
MTVRAVIAMAACLSVSLAGCALFSPPRQEPAKAVLSELPTTIADAPRRASLLVVAPPQAAQAYHTVRMAYSEQPYQLGYFRDHEWAEPPATMIQQLLVQTLERTGAFRAVLTEPDIAANAYTLRTDLLTLVQDFARTPPVLRLVMRAELLGPGGRVAASREFAEEELLAQRTAQGGTVAANAAVARALQAITRFVIEQTR